MNPDIIPLLLPPAFQLLVGGLSIAGKIRFRFLFIGLISMSSHILISITGLFRLKDELMGIPTMHYSLIAIVLFILLALIIAMQLLIRYFLRKRKTD